MNKVDEVINHRESQCKFVSLKDCERRSDEAVEKNPTFFNDPSHVKKVAEVQSIVANFFTKNKGVYINHRIGTKKTGSFSTVKVLRPIFPNVKPDDKEKLFYEPLKNLGVKIIFNPNTNSYLFHVS